MLIRRNNNLIYALGSLGCIIRNLPCFILFFPLLFIPACTKQDNEIIRFGLSARAITLDPRFATDATSYRINRLLYSQLVDFDNNFRPIPSLASWQLLDQKHYRFTLGDKGRTFHNGSTLTSKDVKATYDYILSAKNASPHRGSLAVIKAIKLIDEDTIDFILQKPDPLFPGRLGIGILPEALIASNHPFNRHAIGSGAMRFQNWSSDGALLLQRLLDEQLIRFITVPDPTVRILKLVRGELDLIQGDLSQEMMDWLGQQDQIVIKTARGNTFSYLGFNFHDPVTNQLTVRQAIAHAIDRQAIIHYVMGGVARIAGGIFSPEHWAGNKQLSGLKFDPNQSKYLLKELGYTKDKPLRITYKTSNNPLRIRLASIIQHQLKQVGIQVDIQSYDWGTFYGDIKSGRFQMYSLSWVGLKMPDIFRYIFHSTAVPPHGANRGRFSDTTVDQLIEEAENMPDLVVQGKLYQRLQTHLEAKLPYIPLWYEDNVLAIRKDIAGYTLNSSGNYDSLLTIEHLH